MSGEILQLTIDLFDLDQHFHTHLPSEAVANDIFRAGMPGIPPGSTFLWLAILLLHLSYTVPCPVDHLLIKVK